MGEQDSMKAVVAVDYGPPEQYAVVDLPIPRPGPGQIGVRIAAASINPADVRLPGGDFREVIQLEFPHVPGVDFAGTVTEIGEDVSGYAVGDEVFGLAVPRVLRAMGGKRPSLGTGALAEYAVVEADTPMVAHRPAGLAARDAAALGAAGQAALATARAARVRPGERVLVLGATGGVGTTLVPWLAAAGAHVIATGTETDADPLRLLGAAEIIGYQETGFPAEIDVLVNAVLPADRLAGPAAALRPGGRLLTLTLPFPTAETIGRADVELGLILDMDGDLASMRAVGEAGARGELRPTITRTYRLDQGPQACADFLREHTWGKRVVVIREP